MQPSWLAPDGSKLASRQGNQRRGPAYPAAAAQAAAAASTSVANTPPKEPANSRPDDDYGSDGSEDDNADRGDDLTRSGLRSVLSPEEMAEMRSMAGVADLDLPDVRLPRPPR
jgi:hypothetical protein